MLCVFGQSPDTAQSSGPPPLHLPIDDSVIVDGHDQWSPDPSTIFASPTGKQTVLVRFSNRERSSDSAFVGSPGNTLRGASRTRMFVGLATSRRAQPLQVGQRIETQRSIELVE